MGSPAAGFLVITSLYLLLISGAQGAPGNTNARQRFRSVATRLAGKPALNQLVRIKEPFDGVIVDEDDLFELAKRQTSEDYGHLRFGKRDEFDDYGHMRFGRGGMD